MPKLKTHKGAAARLHVTGTGKLLRRKRLASHNRMTKPKRVRRQFGDTKVSVAKCDVKRLKRLIPNGV